jgi:hypothetical protein
VKEIRILIHISRPDTGAYSEVKFRRVVEIDVKEFKIGVENELRKDKHFREVIENLK